GFAPRQVGLRGLRLGKIAPPRLLLPQLESQSIGDAIQPPAQRRASPNTFGLAQENQERGLKHIVHVGLIIEQLMTSGRDQPPVPPQNRRKRGFILPLTVVGQQLRIGKIVQRLSRSAPPQVTDDLLQWRVGHACLERLEDSTLTEPLPRENGTKS